MFATQFSSGYAGIDKFHYDSCLVLQVTLLVHAFPPTSSFKKYTDLIGLIRGVRIKMDSIMNGKKVDPKKAEEKFRDLLNYTQFGHLNTMKILEVRFGTIEIISPNTQVNKKIIGDSLTDQDYFGDQHPKLSKSNFNDKNTNLHNQKSSVSKIKDYEPY